MAKIYGLFGSMTGKLADTVMSVRNGEQIARKYQPVVFNPSTPAQIAQRAKLKLLSQLSASLAPIIAIKREGSVSSRNLFTKRNHEYAGYAEGEAFITLADVQLTKSSVSLAGFQIDRSGASMALELEESMGNNIDQVVYVVMRKTGNNELLIADSKVVGLSEGGGTFPTTMPKVEGEIVAMAYGIRLNTPSARVKFGNLTVPTAQEIAKILVTMNNIDTDVTLTETRGLQMSETDTHGATSGALRVRVTPIVSTASTGSGSVSGGGRVAQGQSVTLVATPGSNSTFSGWFNVNGSTNVSNRVSTETSYTLTAGNSNWTLYAVFTTNQN